MCRRFALCIVMAACAAFAAFGVATNTWISGKTDWNSAGSYVENRVPSPGDVVVVDSDASVSDADSDSFGVVAALGAIDIANDATMTFDVSGVVTAKCAVCGYALDKNGKVTRSGGKLVKAGEGTLVLSVGANTIGPNYLMRGGTLEIRSGCFKPPADYTSGYCYIGTLAISNGATFFTVGGHSKARTYVSSLAGDGCVTNELSGTANFQIDSASACTFSGSVDGSISFRKPYGRVNLLGTNSLCTAAMMVHENGSIGAKTFGLAGEPSSVGAGSSLAFGGPGGFASLGSGVPAETTDKNLSIDTVGKVYFDGGTNASLTFTGSFKAAAASGSDASQRVMELRGSSGSLCVVAGKVEDSDASNPKCPIHFVKKGLGTWRFADTEDVATDRAWGGGLTVEDGTLLFDSLEERGTACALGLATNLYSSETAALDGAEHVDYAYCLGAGGTEGTLELNGESGNAVWCTTRPAVLKGDARFVNSTSRRFRFVGVSGVGSGARTLTLAGSGAVENVIADISDGEAGCTVSLVKEGSGTWYLDGSNSFSGSISVKAGTLVVRNPANYGWLRWTLRANYGDDFVNIVEFGIYDSAGSRINSGMTTTADFAAIAYNQAAYQTRYMYYELAALSNMFDDTTSLWGAVRYVNNDTNNRILLNESDPSTHIPIVMRLPENAERIDSYDIVGRYGGTRPLKSYLLEGSVDGIHWDCIRDSMNAGTA